MTTQLPISSPTRPAHPYHLVDGSPWPIMMAISIGTLAMSIVAYLHGYEESGISSLMVLVTCIAIATLWWRDVIREAFGGYHSTIVQRSLLISFILFLLSEIMLFGSFFWAYGYASLCPSIELGSVWPPVGITPLFADGIPLLGSILLLSSGFVCTIAHHAIQGGDSSTIISPRSRSLAINCLIGTIFLGILFVALQAFEYQCSTFTISDSVFGSVFYATTGLHALHVIIGLIFLTVCLFRLIADHFSSEHHVGLEFAIFYWHLVDVVWLIVFIGYYCWGGGFSDVIVAPSSH